MARNDEGETGAAEDVVLLVCLKCGREVQFEGGDEPPSDMKCEKCGNQVFRRFEDSGREEESRQDFRDSTDRDTATDDTAEDVSDQDLMDLNNP